MGDVVGTSRRDACILRGVRHGCPRVCAPNCRASPPPASSWPLRCCVIPRCSTPSSRPAPSANPSVGHGGAIPGSRRRRGDAGGGLALLREWRRRDHGPHRVGRPRRSRVGDRIAAAALGSCRRLHPGRRRRGAAPPRGAVRACADRGRRGSRVHRRRHGQARRPRAEFFLRCRPGVPLRRGRRDRRRAPHRPRGVFRTRRPRTDPPARRAHRGRFRLPGGHASAALRRQRGAGRESGVARELSAGAWPRLGALRLDQGARHHGRGGVCRRAPRVHPALRVPPLPRFRRVRFAARHEGTHRPRGGATRTRRSLEARHGRHPRAGVHRAIAAAGAGRQRPAPAELRAARGAAAAGRARSC